MKLQTADTYSGTKLNGGSKTASNGGTSRAPHCLPDDWRGWVAGNLLLGISREQIKSSVVAAGHDAAVVDAEIEAVTADPLYLVADRFAQRFKKVKSLLGVRASLSSLSYAPQSVERRSKISQSEFLERYYVANRPVILSGLLAGSLARKRWTPEYLAEACGNATVQIMAGRHADTRYEINSDAHKRELPMSEYVSMVLQGGPSNDYYLVANNGFFERPEMRTMYKEVPLLPEYLDHTHAEQRTFLWFGPAGTVTPFHHDLMNVLVAQIYGRKRFLLVPPEQTPNMYNEIGVYSEVDAANPDYSRHPLYRQVRPITVQLGPGETLFIPVGWWHHVISVEISIMVSYTNFRFPNDYDWFHPYIT